MRNAKFGILDLGGQQINFDRPLFFLRISRPGERGMKVETNEVLGACYRGGTNLSEKIQVKGPLRRNRTLSN